MQIIETHLQPFDFLHSKDKKEVMEIVLKAHPALKETHKAAMLCLLGNLVKTVEASVLYENEVHRLVVSRDKRFYDTFFNNTRAKKSGDKYKSHWDYYLMIECQDLLEALGYVWIVIGTYGGEDCYGNKIKGERTTLQPTPELVKLLLGRKTERVCNPVRFRDEHKKEMTMKDSYTAKRMAQQINKINSVTSEHTFSIELPYGYAYSMERTLATKARNEVWLSDLDQVLSYCLGLTNVLPQRHPSTIDRIRNITKDFDNYPMPFDRPEGCMRIAHSDMEISNKCVTIHLDPDDLKIYRVFNVHNEKMPFTLGGRFYGSIVQNMPSSWRQYIRIDGEETIEADYSGMHIRMLYHRDGIEFTGDVYSRPGTSRWMRDIYKIVALISINADDEKSAVKAIIDELSIEQKRLLMEANQGKLKIGQCVAKMIEEFRSYHYQIASYLFSGEGLKLQRLDSEIMEWIMCHFSMKGDATIGIHDSIIMKRSHRHDLIRAMEIAYLGIMKFNPVIDVKHDESVEGEDEFESSTPMRPSSKARILGMKATVDACRVNAGAAVVINTDKFSRGEFKPGEIAAYNEMKKLLAIGDFNW